MAATAPSLSWPGGYRVLRTIVACRASATQLAGRANGSRCRIRALDWGSLRSRVGSSGSAGVFTIDEGLSRDMGRRVAAGRGLLHQSDREPVDRPAYRFLQGFGCLKRMPGARRNRLVAGRGPSFFRGKRLSDGECHPQDGIRYETVLVPFGGLCRSDGHQPFGIPDRALICSLTRGLGSSPFCRSCDRRR